MKFHARKLITTFSYPEPGVVIETVQETPDGPIISQTTHYNDKSNDSNVVGIQAREVNNSSVTINARRR